MKKISLNGKYGEGKFALVDDEDFPYLSQFKWHVTCEGYAQRTLHYIKNGKDTTKSIKMHREVMKVTDTKVKIDHIFHNKLDNRKEVLRICTHQENQMNRVKLDGFSSKYKGVSWNKQRNKWRSVIKYNRKQISLGLHSSEAEAALAYNEKAKELFGEFALLNEIRY